MRRTVLTALASLPISGCAAEPPSSGETRQLGSKTLVAFFSRSGNTAVVAGLIHRSLSTDLFEIRPAAAYPEDYLATVEQARRERDQSFEPALERQVVNMAAYEKVYLGFPIWGETTPPVIRTFLKVHDLAGKALIPFITHGGYGVGNSQSVLASHSPKARLQKGFAMEADQERKTMERVKSWLKTD